MWSIYEIIHIWTAEVDESEEWSPQLIFQLMQLERRSLKNSELQRDSNLWPSWCQCHAIPTDWAMKSHIGSELNPLSSYLPTKSEMIWTQLIDLTPNVWLYSSVGRTSIRYGGGHRFESRRSSDFFRLLLSNCLSCKINCGDHFSLSNFSNWAAPQFFFFGGGGGDCALPPRPLPLWDKYFVILVILCRCDKTCMALRILVTCNDMDNLISSHAVRFLKNELA